MDPRFSVEHVYGYLWPGFTILGHEPNQLAQNDQKIVFCHSYQQLSDEDFNILSPLELVKISKQIALENEVYTKVSHQYTETDLKTAYNFVMIVNEQLIAKIKITLSNRGLQIEDRMEEESPRYYNVLRKRPNSEMSNFFENDNDNPSKKSRIND